MPIYLKLISVEFTFATKNITISFKKKIVENSLYKAQATTFMLKFNHPVYKPIIVFILFLKSYGNTSSAKIKIRQISSLNGGLLLLEGND